VAGREVWLGRWGSPEADAKYRQLLATWATGGAAVEAVTPKPRRRPDPVVAATPDRNEHLTVGALLVRYLLEVKAERPVDRKHAKWWLARSIANALEGRRSIPLDQFGPKMLAEVQRELAEQPMPRKCGGHSKRSRAQVAKLVNGIRAMFQWAVAEELVTPDRLVALRSVKPPKAGKVREGDPREPVTDEHIEAAQAHMPPVAAAIVQFCRLTACRPSEAMALRMADVEQLAGVWKWTLAKHKNAHRGKRRVIAIGHRAAAIVRQWSAGKSGTALVFTREGVGRRPPSRAAATIPMQGDPRKELPWDAELLRKFVARACKAASIPGWTWMRGGGREVWG